MCGCVRACVYICVRASLYMYICICVCVREMSMVGAAKNKMLRAET